jgi:two-component system osmolarity sensor histidine kinase EnvZ
MLFTWLKRYVPRSLYGRAALILLAPVVTLQLVVSLVFIQRHFEDVTVQMTRNVAIELRYLLDTVTEAGSPEVALFALRQVAEPLAFEVQLPAAPPATDRKVFYDFSGSYMIRTLRAGMPDVLAIDLASDSRRVHVWLTTPHGILRVAFDRRRVSATNPHQLLVLMLFVGFIMTLIAFVFLRNQLRPIKRLARASEAFGKGRIVPYRPTGAVEVRAAGQAFLDMRERIDRQIEQRTMMLSGVSHDLRTPLTRLRLGLAMLPEDEDTSALLRDISDMERLLDEFLAFARGDSLDDPEDCDPQQIVQQVIQRFEDGVSLARVSGNGRAMLRPMAVTRALENLIGNARRYGSVCKVSLELTPDNVRIIVEDDGPGIPENRRAEALKPFARLDVARNQDSGGGVGLGLAIAHDIARRHGGDLMLGQSQSLGGLRVDLVLAR